LKSITLLYDTRGFQSAEAPGTFFSADDFRKECVRQNLSGSHEVVLRVILHVKRFVIIPSVAGDEEFFSCHFPSHGTLTSCPLGDNRQKIVYEFPDELYQQLSEILPRCYMLPDCALMARYSIEKSSSGSSKGGDDVFVICCPEDSTFSLDRTGEPSALSLFLASNGQLKFANSFQAGSLEEVRYFVMAIKEKFCNGNSCLLCNDEGSLPAIKEILQPFFTSIDEVALAAAHSEPFMGLFSDIIL